MTTKDRLLDFLSYKKIGQTKFEEICGLSRGLVNNIRGSISSKTMQKIESVFPELNLTWLLTGEGEMLKGGTQGEAGGVTIPASVWNVIEKQAESLAARDRQLEMLLKSRDEQIDELVAIVRNEIREMKKTSARGEDASYVAAG